MTDVFRAVRRLALARNTAVSRPVRGFLEHFVAESGEQRAALIQIEKLFREKPFGMVGGMVGKMGRMTGPAPIFMNEPFDGSPEGARFVSADSMISFWDALILVAAAGSGASVLYSEDLQAGRELLGVRIVNPFESS